MYILIYYIYRFCGWSTWNWLANDEHSWHFRERECHSYFNLMQKLIRSRESTYRQHNHLSWVRRAHVRTHEISMQRTQISSEMKQHISSSTLIKWDSIPSSEQQHSTAVASVRLTKLEISSCTMAVLWRVTIGTLCHHCYSVAIAASVLSLTHASTIPVIVVVINV